MLLLSKRLRPMIAVCFALLILGGCVTYHPFPQTTTMTTDLLALPSGRTDAGYLYVEMRINGTGPFRILIDTGSVGLFVNADVAAAANLRPLANTVMHGTTDQEKAVLSRADAVQCGDLLFRGVDTNVVADGKDPLLARLKFDGVAGLSLFRDVVLVLDFPRHRVRVRRLESMNFPADRALPFTGIMPAVPLQVAGQIEPALLDSGSAYTLIVGGFDSLPFVHPPVKDEGLAALASVP
jgi:hypothetical protein